MKTRKKSVVKSSKISEEVIIILLIVAIVLSILSIFLTWSFSANDGFFSNSLKESSFDNAGVGLNVQGTVANTKNG
jgi:hypothetical protein